MGCCGSLGTKVRKLAFQVGSFTLTAANVIANALQKGEIVADEGTVARRLEQCKKCRHLKSQRCDVCGCFISIKAGVKVAKCPLNKW